MLLPLRQGAGLMNRLSDGYAKTHCTQEASSFLLSLRLLKKFKFCLLILLRNQAKSWV